jgi:hypothetical protein
VGPLIHFRTWCSTASSLKSVAMPGAFLLILEVCLAIFLAAVAHLSPVLVDAQPVLQLLCTALLFWRRVPFALLLVQRVELLLKSVVTRPGRLIGVSHSRFLLPVRQPCRPPSRSHPPRPAQSGSALDRQNGTMCLPVSGAQPGRGREVSSVRCPSSARRGLVIYRTLSPGGHDVGTVLVDVPLLPAVLAALVTLLLAAQVTSVQNAERGLMQGERAGGQQHE